MTPAKVFKLLEREIARLSEENKRLTAQNDELVKKVLALSNEGAYLLTNGSDREATPIHEVKYNEWGDEVLGEKIN